MVMAERNYPEHRRIEVPGQRPAELVAARVAPGVARLREDRRVVPRLVGSRLAVSRLRRAIEVDGLLPALLLQQSVVTGDGERPAGQPGRDAVDLPVLDQ